MSVPKEPMFFLTDFPKLRIIKNEATYLKCFKPRANDNARVVAEASALYLVSEEAVGNILAFNQNSKVIVMIRNPIKMALSLHAQNLFYGDEDIQDFADAWKCQSARRSGTGIPKSCRDPLLVDYEKNCKLGALLKRLFDQVPSQQRCVVVLDDLINSPAEVYESLLQWLELPSDGRNVFPKVNERKAAKSVWLNRLLAKPPRPLSLVANVAKRTLNVRSVGIHSVVASLNSREAPPVVLTPEAHAMLMEAFSADIDLLGNLMSRDLSNWKNYQVTSA